MRWTIPNILTIFRLIMAPALGFILIFSSESWGAVCALLIFLLAAVTDYLDGYLARILDQASNFGKLLDPIADKAMIVITLCFININNMDQYSALGIGIPTIFILFREIFVSGLREFLAGKSGSVEVSVLAKYKTTFQMISIAFLLSAQIEMFSFFPALLFGQFLLWLAAILTLITGWDYLRNSITTIEEN